MKIVVRSFVAALALAGFVASTQTLPVSAHSKPSVTKVSAMPTPWCPPDDPNACGI